MSLVKFLTNNDLAPGGVVTKPADRDFPSRMRADKPGWVHGYNNSPFVFEIQDEGGTTLTLALPFTPFKHPLFVRTEKIIIHASTGAMVPANPLAPADLAFYLAVSEFEPDLYPSAW